MLKKDRGGKGIDIAASASRRSVHFADGTLRGRGGEALIDETHGKTRAPYDLGTDGAYLTRSRRILPLFVERQPEHEPPRLEVDAARDDLRDRWTLSRAPQKKPRW